jgi:hypothetical protein
MSDADVCIDELRKFAKRMRQFVEVEDTPSGRRAFMRAATELEQRAAELHGRRQIRVTYPDREPADPDRMVTLNNPLTREQAHRVAEALHLCGIERAMFTAVQEPGEVRIAFRRATPEEQG